MVRTRAKNKTKRGPHTIILDDKMKSCWDELKEKFKIKSDRFFLLFLLDYAKNELTRKTRQEPITEPISEATRSSMTDSSKNVATLRFRHIGNKKYQVCNEPIAETDSEAAATKPAVLLVKRTPSRQLAGKAHVKNTRKCALCKSSHNLRMSSCPQNIKAGLETKIFANAVAENKGSIVDVMLRDSLTTIRLDSLDFEQNQRNCDSDLETGVVLKPDLSLKVSDMVKSRFDDDESDDDLIEPSTSLLQTFEVKQVQDTVGIHSFEEKLPPLKLTFSKSKNVGAVDIVCGNFNFPQLAASQAKASESEMLNLPLNYLATAGGEASEKTNKQSLVLSQLSSSAENTQETSQTKSIINKEFSPSRKDSEKENHLIENESVPISLSKCEKKLKLENVKEQSRTCVVQPENVSEQKGAKPNVEEDDSEKPMETQEEIWEPSLPAEFSLRIADPMHGPSVFVNEPWLKGEQLGPLLGVLIREMDIPDDSNMHDIWQVGTTDSPQYLSTRDAEQSDWLRHIRPAPKKEAANCVTTPIDGRLLFRTTRALVAGEELLYWTDDVHPKWAKKRLDKTGCGGCNLQLGHVLYYRTHCMLFHDPSCSLNIRKYYCKVCGAPVLGKDKIISHAIEAHQGKGAYQCQFCFKFFLRLRHLELHRNYGCARNPNRSKAKCEQCGHEFSQPQKLKTHIRRMHSEALEVVLKEFQCVHCKKVLGSGPGLLRHKKEVHNKSLAAATCDRCGKIFQNKSNLKIHMLTHSGVKPFKCQEADCTVGFTTKQRLQAHYKNTHGLSSDALPKIQRSVAFTFDAYCGSRREGETSDEGRVGSPSLHDENQSEGMSPLSVGCSADLPLLSVPRPDEYSEDETGGEETDGGGAVLPYTTGEGEDNGGSVVPYVGDIGPDGGGSVVPYVPEGAVALPSKGSRKWMGSPALYRIDNYSASLLVEEAICAAEKDIIEKDVMDGVLPYDALPPYMGSPPLEEQRQLLPRDYSASSPPLEDQRDMLRGHLYSSSSPPLSDHREMLRAHLYNPSPTMEEPREMLRTHILQRSHSPPLGFKMNPLPRDYCVSSPPLEEPRDLLKANPLLRDYNISSLIREDLQDADQDGRGCGLIDPGKDPEVSEYRSGLYRDESRDGLGELRRPDVYRRDGYDMGYPGEGEAQNLSLKEKSLQLDLSYKAYEGLDELERIGRETAGLETLLVGDQTSQTLGRSLHLSPRYPPTYDTESMDLSLPRLPYPPSPIYSLELPGRFDLPSGRLVDLRSHLGLSPHRFPNARVVAPGAGSPPSSSYLYQPTFAAPSARHSPTPSYHPYSAYY